MAAPRTIRCLRIAEVQVLRSEGEPIQLGSFDGGGSVCLNSFEPFLMWNSRSVVPRPGDPARARRLKLAYHSRWEPGGFERPAACPQHIYRLLPDPPHLEICRSKNAKGLR